MSQELLSQLRARAMSVFTRPRAAPVPRTPERPGATTAGAELRAIVAELGLSLSLACGCKSLARQMDAWGLAGCRLRKTSIVIRLREGEEAWGWTSRLKDGKTAVYRGHVFRLTLPDPYPALVDEVLRRVEVASLPDPPLPPLGGTGP